MGDVRNEPSMDDILASIKRIIAEDGAAAIAASRGRPLPARAMRPDPAPIAPAKPPVSDDGILELTEAMSDRPSQMVSAGAAQASRHSLAALSAMIVRADPDAAAAPANTLEGLVSEMLRPMLKEWLDAHLPELVEGLVAREIARITGKTL